MASDDESVEIKLVSTPPRLSEKEKKSKKIELEFMFRSEVRSLKGYFSSCYYCLFGWWF